MNKRFLTIKELSEYTGWGETKLREIANREESTFTLRCGRNVYIDKEKFDEYLEKCIKYKIRI